MIKVDLHTHSSFSDGALTVNELLELAVKQHIREIAITDHETITNLRDYKQLENQYAIKIIPGIEIPTTVKGLHILGYGIKNFEMMESFVDGFKAINQFGAVRTIELLQHVGIDISIKQVTEVMTSSIITKRDIAQYMVKKGYATTTYEVYQNFIGRGNKAYVPVHKIPFEEVLTTIGECGGISVIAHPHSLPHDTDFDALIPYMKRYGLIGMETQTVRHTLEERMYFSEIAKKFKLCETAGTDFHNTTDGIIPGFEVEDEFLNEFHSCM